MTVSRGNACIAQGDTVLFYVVRSNFQKPFSFPALQDQSPKRGWSTAKFSDTAQWHESRQGSQSELRPSLLTSNEPALMICSIARRSTNVQTVTSFLPFAARSNADGPSFKPRHISYPATEYRASTWTPLWIWSLPYCLHYIKFIWSAPVCGTDMHAISWQVLFTVFKKSRNGGVRYQSASRVADVQQACRSEITSPLEPFLNASSLHSQKSSLPFAKMLTFRRRTTKMHSKCCLLTVSMIGESLTQRRPEPFIFLSQPCVFSAISVCGFHVHFSWPFLRSGILPRIS